MKERDFLSKILVVVILLMVACVSFFLIAKLATSNMVITEIHNSIDQKTHSVLGLSASSAAISTGLSLLPGDAATPIAQKLADLAGYFLLILCVLYAESNLLAVIGTVVFKCVIPVACAMLMICQFWRNDSLRTVACKLVIFGLGVFCAIPISIKVSDAIYENHRELIETTIQEAEDMKEDTSKLSEADEKNNPVASILDGIKETTSGLVNKGTQMLNRFVESIAVLIVTTCVMPLLALVFILWLLNKCFGVKVDYSKLKRKKKPEPVWENEE